MSLSLEYLRQNAGSSGWGRDSLLDNIALGKPAWQSSVCRWSKFNDVCRDAEGANNGVTELDCGFHTDDEAEPWWVVDLHSLYTVDEVVVHNRIKYAERLGRFSIQASLDGIAWNVAKTAHVDDFHETSSPFDMRIRFMTPVVARYLERFQFNSDHIRPVSSRSPLKGGITRKAFDPRPVGCFLKAL
jgi:hypothetical protein